MDLRQAGLRSWRCQVAHPLDAPDRQTLSVRAEQIRYMSHCVAHEESPAVSLNFGLLAVAGLLYSSVLALTGPVWMGVLFGGIELLVAWLVTPPVGARSLRGITALLGAGRATARTT